MRSAPHEETSRRVSTKVSIGRLPVGEFLLWLLPLLLALAGHLYAWPKADLSDTGPGWRIQIMNERTLRAQRAWHVLNSNWALFVVYGAVLVTTFVLLRVKAAPWPVRLGIFAALAIPGFWYFALSSYLGGKLLS
jgi:hypothetical protein